MAVDPQAFVLPEIPRDVAGLWKYERQLPRWDGWHEYNISTDPHKKAAYLRAHSLLASMLTNKQLHEMVRWKRFYVTLANGHRYRFNPLYGTTSRVLWEKDRWLPAINFCFHSENYLTPPPDTTIQHLCVLAVGEKVFLEGANHEPAQWYQQALAHKGMIYDYFQKRVRPQNKDERHEWKYRKRIIVFTRP